MNAILLLFAVSLSLSSREVANPIFSFLLALAAFIPISIVVRRLWISRSPIVW